MINHATTEVFFDDLRVPQENLIGEEGKGFRYIIDGMNAERILIASECIGDSRWFMKKQLLMPTSVSFLIVPSAKIRAFSFPSLKPMRQLRLRP